MTTDEPVLACIWFKILCDSCGLRYEQQHKLGYSDIGEFRPKYNDLAYQAYKWVPAICGACGSHDILAGFLGIEIGGVYSNDVRTGQKGRQDQIDQHA